MPHLIWCMLTVGAFGIGLAVASLHYSAATRVPAAPLAAAADWQRQVTMLQGHIRTQDAELTTLRQQVQMLSEIPPGMEPAAPPGSRPRRPKKTVMWPFSSASKSSSAKRSTSGRSKSSTSSASRSAGNGKGRKTAAKTAS